MYLKVTSYSSRELLTPYKSIVKLDKKVKSINKKIYGRCNYVSKPFKSEKIPYHGLHNFTSLSLCQSVTNLLWSHHNSNVHDIWILRYVWYLTNLRENVGVFNNNFVFHNQRIESLVGNQIKGKAKLNRNIYIFFSLHYDCCSGIEIRENPCLSFIRSFVMNNIKKRIFRVLTENMSIFIRINICLRVWLHNSLDQIINYKL